MSAAHAPGGEGVLLPALVPSTIAEHRRTFRHSLMAADREQRWQAGMLTEPRSDRGDGNDVYQPLTAPISVIGSGPVVALPEPARMRLLISQSPAYAIKHSDTESYRRYCGMLCTPSSSKNAWNAVLHGVPWAIDNCAFSGFDERAFVRLLKRYEGIPGCLWAVAPDVVCDAKATLSNFQYWHKIVRAYGFPVAYAAQNGIEETEIPWQDFRCLFIGGDNSFKLGNQAAMLIKEAKARGKWVHMGRVSTMRRLRLAQSYGCDSVDSSCFAAYPQRIKQILPTLREINSRVPLMEVA